MLWTLWWTCFNATTTIWQEKDDLGGKGNATNSRGGNFSKISENFLIFRKIVIFLFLNFQVSSDSQDAMDLSNWIQSQLGSKAAKVFIILIIFLQFYKAMKSSYILGPLWNLNLWLHCPIYQRNTLKKKYTSNEIRTK